ncbi:MAG: pyridoxamine 5'-phosphate oxidase family protein [Candidatus Methanofastidiosia archaeon]
MGEIGEEMHQILMECHIAYVCTSDAKNTPHVTPVFYLYDPFKKLIYFVSSERTKKIKNLKENPKVSLTVDIRDPNNPFRNRGVMVRGLAEVLMFELSDEFLKTFYLKFKHKYISVIEIETEKLEEVLVRIKPQSISFWHGSRFKVVRL